MFSLQGAASTHLGGVKVDQGGFERQAHDQGQPLGCGAHTGDDRCRVAFDIFKKKCRPALLFVELGDMRQLKVPVDFRGDPFAQTDFFTFGNKIPHVFHFDTFLLSDVGVLEFIEFIEFVASIVQVKSASLVFCETPVKWPVCFTGVEINKETPD
jgi:hypothetical protein